jgi:hypothetical protein
MHGPVKCIGDVPFFAFFLTVVSLSSPSHIHHSQDAVDLV